MSEAEYQARLVRTGAPLSLPVRPTPSTALAITVPVPPSINHGYVTIPEKGLRALSKVGREYKKAVTQDVEGASILQKWFYRPGARLSLSLKIFFPNKQRRDISNCVKLCEDSLSAALGFDDTVVDILHVERGGIDPENPRCEIRLAVIG